MRGQKYIQNTGGRWICHIWEKTSENLDLVLCACRQLEDKTIDIEQTKEMVDLFMEAGFTYFDTAWAYAGSEDAIRQALVERYPREKFQACNQEHGMDQL